MILSVLVIKFIFAFFDEFSQFFIYKQHDTTYLKKEKHQSTEQKQYLSFLYLLFLIFAQILEKR